MLFHLLPSYLFPFSTQVLESTSHKIRREILEPEILLVLEDYRTIVSKKNAVRESKQKSITHFNHSLSFYLIFIF